MLEPAQIERPGHDVKRWGRLNQDKWMTENVTPEFAKAYALAIVTDDKQTSVAPERALMAVHPACYKWSQSTRLMIVDRLLRRVEVSSEITRLREEQFAGKALGKAERRALLAEIARTPIVDILDAIEMDVATEEQKAVIKKIKTKIDESGVKTTEIEGYDRIAALRLDAELTGDIGRNGAPMVQVNVNTAEPIERKVERLLGSIDVEVDDLLG